MSALQRGDKDAAYRILLWQKSLIEAGAAALRKVDAEALDIDHLPAALVDMPVLECECTEYSDIDINASSCREGGEVYILASVRQLSPWFVYELEIKWSFEHDKLTHTEFITQTWKSVANAVKGSYTLREPLVQPWRGRLSFRYDGVGRVQEGASPLLYRVDAARHVPRADNRREPTRSAARGFFCKCIASTLYRHSVWGVCKSAGCEKRSGPFVTRAVT
jgi:hypothetical protein